MSHKTNGCLNCTERHVGCHGKCERYLAWKKEQELVNGTGDKEREARDVLYSYTSRTVRRNSRKAGKKIHERI